MQPLAIYTVSTTKTNHPFNLTSSHRKVWRLEAAQGGYPSGAPTGHQWCLEVKRGDMMSMGISYPSLVIFFSLLQGDFFFWKGFLALFGMLNSYSQNVVDLCFQLFWADCESSLLKKLIFKSCEAFHVPIYSCWPMFVACIYCSFCI